MASTTTTSSLKTITLNWKGQNVEVALFGGHALSYKTADGIDVLYMSQQTKLDGSKAIRGGIPIVFPQFGRPDEAMASHGFARTSTWEVSKEVETNDECCSAELQLKDSESTRSQWPHAFLLKQNVKLDKDGFTTKLSIENVDDKPFSCQTLLHTYLSTYPDVQHANIMGFNANKYTDSLDNGKEVEDRERAIIVAEEVDRIYIGDEAFMKDISIMHSIGGASTDISRKASLTKKGEAPASLTPDTVFWNPWVEKTKRLGDMELDGYTKFVCVEPGLVKKMHEVEPGAVLELQQTIKYDMEG